MSPPWGRELLARRRALLGDGGHATGEEQADEGDGHERGQDRETTHDPSCSGITRPPHWGPRNEMSHRPAISSLILLWIHRAVPVRVVHHGLAHGRDLLGYGWTTHCGPQAEVFAEPLQEGDRHGEHCLHEHQVGDLDPQRVSVGVDELHQVTRGDEGEEGLKRGA